MRTYAKNFAWKKTATYKQRASRCALEWDVRLDVSDDLKVEDIINNIKSFEDGILYVLVSGVEAPEPAPAGERVQLSRSDSEHVHLCLILHTPLQRLDVLRLLRGPRKLGGEYCAPRNPKFSYIGWVIHHTKLEAKIPGEPPKWYEYGTLPMDPLTTEWSLAIDRMVKKYKCPMTVHERAQPYLALLAKNKIKEKIEKLQMTLEDSDVE
jgi:hypothetical protein